MKAEEEWVRVRRTKEGRWDGVWLEEGVQDRAKMVQSK